MQKFSIKTRVISDFNKRIIVFYQTVPYYAKVPWKYTFIDLEISFLLLGLVELEFKTMKAAQEYPYIFELSGGLSLVSQLSLDMTPPARFEEPALAADLFL